MRIDPPFTLVERASRMLYDRQQEAMAARAAREGGSCILIPWTKLNEGDRQRRMQAAKMELEKILCDQEDAIVDMVRQIADAAKASTGSGSSGQRTATDRVDRHQTTRPG